VVIEMETKTLVAAPAPAPATLIPITTDSKSITKSSHDATPMFSWWIFGCKPRFGAYLWWALTLLGLSIVITAFTWGVILLVRTTDSVHANCGNLSWGAEGECSKANKLQEPDGGLLTGGIILIIVSGCIMIITIIGFIGIADEAGCFAN